MLNYSANSKTGYFLQRSLRFRASASAYLSRTPGVASNRQTWTYNFWGKIGSIPTVQEYFICAGSTANDRFQFTLEASGVIGVANLASGLVNAQLVTSQVFRDYSGFYNITLVADTTNATAANRLKLYVNGAQVTSFSTATYPAQNTQLVMSVNDVHNIGRYVNGASNYFDGYMAEVNFIDGQALTPSSFGSTNSTTGVWQPAKYTGTYGTNGFYLPFTDNSALTTSSNVGLGKDFSGNGNYWTTNNISITAGTTYDSMTDVPTLTSATAANYCVLSQLDNSSNGVQVVLSNANLELSLGSGQGRATFSVSSGKWYWEITSGTTNQGMFGIVKQSVPIANATFSSADGYYYWATNGQKFNNGTGTAYGSALASGDILGVAYDADAGTLTYYKNNVSLGTAFSGLSGTFSPAFCQGNTTAYAAFNFGQRPFTYTPPSGYVALNTYNLPDSTIKQGSTQMNAVLQLGSAVNTGANLFAQSGYTYGMVWGKDRAAVNNNQIVDTNRGTSNVLQTNTTSADTTYAAPTSGNNCVAWAWNSNAAGVSNTSGTITSTVSVNASAGFSIVTFNGNGTSGATVGHGLGVAPKFIIVKNRTTAQSWLVYHTTTGATNYFVLNSTAATAASAAAWNNTSPTSSVFSLGNSVACNESGSAFVAYCWTDIAGFSSIGGYTGNGDGTNAPFIYIGFTPELLIVKASSGAASWLMLDASRSTYNVMGAELYSDLSNAETTGIDVDFVSNGFKFRNSTNTFNAVGSYVYVAFAKNPFKNSIAR